MWHASSFLSSHFRQENDQYLTDMQDRLDEALEELAARKKEQAEYKGKDRTHAMVVRNVSCTQRHLVLMSSLKARSTF